MGQACGTMCSRDKKSEFGRDNSSFTQQIFFNYLESGRARDSTTPSEPNYIAVSRLDNIMSSASNYWTNRQRFNVNGNHRPIVTYNIDNRNHLIKIHNSVFTKQVHTIQIQGTKFRLEDLKMVAYDSKKKKKIEASFKKSQKMIYKLYKQYISQLYHVDQTLTTQREDKTEIDAIDSRIAIGQHYNNIITEDPTPRIITNIEKPIQLKPVTTLDPAKSSMQDPASKIQVVVKPESIRIQNTTPSKQSSQESKLSSQPTLEQQKSTSLNKQNLVRLSEDITQIQNNQEKSREQQSISNIDTQKKSLLQPFSSISLPQVVQPQLQQPQQVLPQVIQNKEFINTSINLIKKQLQPTSKIIITKQPEEQLQEKQLVKSLQGSIKNPITNLVQQNIQSQSQQQQQQQSQSIVAVQVTKIEQALKNKSENPRPVPQISNQLAPNAPYQPIQVVSQSQQQILVSQSTKQEVIVPVVPLKTQKIQQSSNQKQDKNSKSPKLNQVITEKPNKSNQAAQNIKQKDQNLNGQVNSNSDQGTQRDQGKIKSLLQPFAPQQEVKSLNQIQDQTHGALVTQSTPSLNQVTPQQTFKSPINQINQIPLSLITEIQQIKQDDNSLRDQQAMILKKTKTNLLSKSPVEKNKQISKIHQQSQVQIKPSQQLENKKTLTQLTQEQLSLVANSNQTMELEIVETQIISVQENVLVQNTLPPIETNIEIISIDKNEDIKQGQEKKLYQILDQNEPSVNILQQGLVAKIDDVTINYQMDMNPVINEQDRQDEEQQPCDPNQSKVFHQNAMNQQSWRKIPVKLLLKKLQRKAFIKQIKLIKKTLNSLSEYQKNHSQESIQQKYTEVSKLWPFYESIKKKQQHDQI